MNEDASIVLVRCWARSSVTVESIEMGEHQQLLRPVEHAPYCTALVIWHDAREILAGRREAVIAGYGKLSTELTEGNATGPCFSLIQIEREYLCEYDRARHLPCLESQYQRQGRQ